MTFNNVRVPDMFTCKLCGLTAPDVDEETLLCPAGRCALVKAGESLGGMKWEGQRHDPRPSPPPTIGIERARLRRLEFLHIASFAHLRGFDPAHLSEPEAEPNSHAVQVNGHVVHALPEKPE